MPKKKLLFIGIGMYNGGTEKSFLSFLHRLDFDRFDVDLLLARREGLFMDQIPQRVHVVEMDSLGELFLLSGKNAAELIWKCFRRYNPVALFGVVPYFVKLILAPKKRTETATRLWVHLMKQMEAPSEIFAKYYDAAAAYWGERTMFYMIDKINARRKIAWMHFEYDSARYDDATYRHYFSKCDAVVNVSNTVNRAMLTKFPELASKCLVIENINEPAAIREMSLYGETYPDYNYRGARILSAVRLTAQKGPDLAIRAMAMLRKAGYEARWYFLGGGEMLDELKVLSVDEGVADIVRFLPPTPNPYPFMRDCTIYVQPSRYEGKPVVVEEAKILACPIVATDYQSAAEQLADGRYGLICQPTAESIFEAVKQMLDDPDLRDAFTQTLAKTDFSNAREIEKFYGLIGE